MEALLQGATDFIIKPFADEVLLQKVFKYLAPDAQQTETVTVDLSRYIKGELKKAQKGHFAVSAMVMALSLPTERRTDPTESRIAENIFFDEIKDLFWETDIFIRFDAKFFLGVFPFCDEKNTKIINQKIHTTFEDMKQRQKLLKDYQLKNVYVSYPFDTGEDADKVIDLLLCRMKEQMNEDSLQT